MLYSHPDIHKSFLLTELKKIIGDDSFASYAWEAIGAELDCRLVNWYDEDEESSLFNLEPAASLYYWVNNGWLLDPLWVVDDDGHYFDCQMGSECQLPAGIDIKYSPAQLVATYGFWLLKIELNSMGEPPKNGELYSNNGVTLDEFRQHETACFFHACQALVYALKLQTGDALSTEELEKAARVSLALKAADARHGKPGGSRDKQKLMREIWATGKYSSREICAEQEAAHLGISFTTARKALRNTPDPSPCR